MPLIRQNIEEFYILGYYAVWPTESHPTFRGNMTPPSLKYMKKWQVSCLDYSPILKVEVTYSLESSIDFQRLEGQTMESIITRAVSTSNTTNHILINEQYINDRTDGGFEEQKSFSSSQDQAPCSY
jgi:hypothetical protein